MNFRIKKHFSLFIYSAASLLGIIFLLSCTNKNDISANNPDVYIISDKPASLRMMAVGDILAHDTVNQAAFNESTGKYDYTVMLKYMLPILKHSDLQFTNQESMASPRFSVAGYPRFNAPYDFIDSIINSGFNIISIANNHSLDHGDCPIQDTALYYEKNYPEAAVNGYNQDCDSVNYTKFEKNGITFTFTASSYSSKLKASMTNCNVNIIEDKSFKKLIKESCSEGDVNIVSVHFGIEDSNKVSEKDEELIQFLLDSGVEIILGHHPHVLKPIRETVNSQGNEAIVAYSLGNFLHSQLYESQRVGGILDFIITKTEGLIKISDVSVHLNYMYYYWGDENYDNYYDLLNRVDLQVVPMDLLNTYTNYQHQDEMMKIAKKVIDEKYLSFIPTTPYLNPKPITNTSNPLMLINKHSYLPENYRPDELVTPDAAVSNRTGSKVHIVSKSIEQNVEELFDAGKNAGFDLILVSGYRSFAVQRSLYNKYVNRSSVEEADTYSARPGHSEHQSGIAFDVSERSIDARGVDAFTGTHAAQWIAENAHKFGFIIRYPENKVSLTQYMYESWHLRYVGMEAAAEIYINNWCLEEYLYYKNQ